MVVVAVNGDEGFSLWSEDLSNKESQKFEKTSGFFCSFVSVFFVNLLCVVSLSNRRSNSKERL